MHKSLTAVRVPFYLLFWSFFLFVAGTSSGYAAWFDNNWRYRVPVNIPAGAAVNSTIKVDVDFAALLTTLGVSGTFDVNSPRVVRPNDTLSTIQQYTDSIHSGVTDAVNNNRGEVRFILEDAGTATYYIYFDVTSSGVKAVNPQTPINGNFEFGDVAGTSPQIPPGWLNATRSATTMDSRIRPAETLPVTDSTSVTTNGNPNTGLASYLQGFRSSTDTGGNAVLTKIITFPASNPGTISINIRPEGWDSGQNNNTTNYDFLLVRLMNGNTAVLNIVGPSLGNYNSCPFSPNYRAGAISSTQPGYGLYNYWDNATSTNHILGMSATYNRGQEPWITCSANLNVAGVAGQTLTLEIRSNNVNQFRSWFLIDDLEWSVVTASLGAPSANVSGVVAANFNCVETGGNASSGRLYTKLAGTGFSFDVVALKSDGNVEMNFVSGTSKNVLVELVDGTGTTACASRTALSPAVSQTLTFASGNQGRKTSASMTVNKAYPNLRCRVTDANQSPNVVGCSADNFAVRPTGFTVTSNINADVSGASASATPTIKTGANFTLNAASGRVGYNALPQLDASKLAAHSGASQSGVLSGSFTAADSATGLATGTTFTYSEVGYFRLASNGVYDSAFTSVDATANDCSNDFSNTQVGGLYGCKFGNATATVFFGRFIPDHFAITQGTVSPACNSSFTYFGQDGFSTVFTLKAQNSSNNTTQNYQGGFAKLGLTAWNGFNFSSASLPAGSALSASSTAPTGVWSLGLADVVAKHQVSRPASLAGETSIIVKAAPVDSDNVTMTAATVAPGTPLRYGRLNLESALGSELLPLTVSLTAQYWNGSAFILNTDDSCTSVSAPASGSGLTFYPEVATGVQGNHLASSETTATVSITGKLASGDAQLKFSAPGAGNDGYFDLNITAPNWLKYDWNVASSGDESPSGHVTFGVYKGNDSQIYLREVY